MKIIDCQIVPNVKDGVLTPDWDTDTGLTTPEQGRCENVWLVVFWLCVVPFTVDFVMFVYMWLFEYL